ncbi:octanoyltransferase LipM [Spirochaetia bacterium]|nr:octanoyltransferase LipM [Spirochaetia bacterium]
MNSNAVAYPFRLLRTGFRGCYYNMGLDEALLESVSGGRSLPALRLYGWAPQAVSVGYFQGLEEEVDLEACKRRGTDVVRRITGGGAVFHHRELTYSIIMPDTHPLAGKGIQDSYAILCAGITRSLSLLDLESQFVPINDILCGDRKISGNAQTRRGGVVLQHGTIMLDLDVELMFELLRVPAEKMKGRIIQEVKSRVTSLRDCLNRAVSFEEAEAALIEGFRQALSLEFTADTPTPEEAARAAELAETKFASPEWLRKR